MEEGRRGQKMVEIEGRQLGMRGGFDVDDAVQGFDGDEAGDVQDEMDAEIERPAEGTASRSEQRLGEEEQRGGHAAHGREQEAGSGRPRRQVAQS